MIKFTPVLSFFGAGILFLSSCVPTSKFNASQMALSSARYDSAQLANKVKDLQSQLTQANQLAADHKHQIDSLSQQIDQAQPDRASHSRLPISSPKSISSQPTPTTGRRC